MQTKSLIFALDGFAPRSARPFLYVGTEFRLVEWLCIRAGVNTRASKKLGGLAGLTGGLGFNLGRLSLDYAFSPFGILGNINRVSIGYFW